MRALLGWLVVVGLFVSGGAYAESDSAPADLSLKAAKLLPIDAAWRATLPRDPVAATDMYLARIPPAAKARSDAYFEGGYWILLWKTLFSLAVMYGLLRTGLSRKIRDWSERTTRFKFLQVCLYAIAFIGLTSVVGFPLSVYTDFFREHAYGLSNQTFGQWFGDQAKGEIIGFILGAPAIAILYACVRKFPKTYHTWATALSIVFLAFMMLVEPVFIDPLFNDYKPLSNGPIRDKLLAMARSNGIPATDIFQFDASKQSDRISANVSGFGKTTAIRLNDNLLRRTTEPEIMSVAGHEMGHYVLNHLYKSIAEFAVVFFLLFTLIRWSFERIQNGAGATWGIRSAGDTAGLPLVVGLLTFYSFFMTPIFNTLVRTEEAEADLFGLNTAREPDADAEIDLKLAEYRKPDPGPIEEFVFFDHPSARNRILMAMRWKAENPNR